MISRYADMVGSPADDLASVGRQTFVSFVSSPPDGVRFAFVHDITGLQIYENFMTLHILTGYRHFLERRFYLISNTHDKFLKPRE